MAQKVSATAAQPVTGVLQSNASAVGAGSPLPNLLGLVSVLFTVTGTFSGGITFQGGSQDGATLTNLMATQLGTNLIGPTATAPGIYEVDITGLSAVQAPVTSYTSGS